MAVRASMAALIARVRTLIYDPQATAFADQQVQDALDNGWRVEQRFVPLIPRPTFEPGGGILYLDYYADTPNWEDDILLQDMSYNALTPATAEPIPGHWTFAVQPNGIGVRATGKTYDLYGAAADLLDSWAAQVKLDFSFTQDRDQFQRMQRFQMITDLALKYRSLAGPRIGRLVQGDAAPDMDGAGVTYPALRAGTYGAG